MTNVLEQSRVIRPTTTSSAVRVRSEQDLVDAVLAARATAGRVRAVGSRGSKNDCFRTSGTTLHLDDYDRLLSVDGNRVTVEAGMRVGTLNEHLAARGLAVPTPGEWAGATVAGALSTGTHGGSLVHGILCTSVLGLRVVGADGRAFEVRRGTALFRHAGVSLGLLGVISTVTFDCVPRFHLEMVTRVTSFDRYRQDHEALAREHEFLSAVWIPTAGKVVTFAADRTVEPRRVVPRRLRYSPETVLASLLSRRMGWHRLPPRWFARSAADDGHRIIAPIRTPGPRVRLLRSLVRSVEMEVAVPLADGAATLGRLEGLLARHPLSLAGPVGLRATAGDEFSLSPCHGRPTLWIALFFDPARDPGFAAELRALLEDAGARCHWGKHLGLSPEHLRRQYPRWDAFHATRRALDPDGIFGNAFSRRLER